MIGWCSDAFRLYWGLVYWNLRKSWFQLRRGRGAPPCQAQSDSGRAYETQCEACTQWDHPERFRRVCPLLVATHHGLRCSADAAEVRPFWRRTLHYYGGMAGGLYLAAVVVIFGFLRSVGYPVSIFHVGLPPLWYRVGEARGWFFLTKAQQAFEEKRASEGLLYLTNAYEMDPRNYSAGLALAKHLQAGQAVRSDELFLRLMREHPERRQATAQEWFRALLARGSFARISSLARSELLAGGGHGHVWVRAVIFAARQSRSDVVLADLAAHASPLVQPWRNIFQAELLLHSGKTREARALIESAWPATAPAFCLFYRISVLIEMRDAFAALDLLGRFPDRLDEEASATLRLDALAAGGMQRPLLQEVDRLLATPMTPATLSVMKILCAHMIRFPNQVVFDRVMQKVARDPIPLHTESAGVWFSLFCAAGAVKDRPRLHELAAQLRMASDQPFMVLSAVEAFFRGEAVDRRLTSYLPWLPLPLEVTYALLERFPSETTAGAKPKTE